MKQTLVLALAAGVSQVAATGFHKFPPFTCPGNTDNKCDDKKKGGFSWTDLNIGDFNSYNNFDFKGWTCQNNFLGKRDELLPRTFGSKCIAGSAQPDKSKCPSFGSKDKFSIGEYQVSVEFDCDLEFHYAMPDGSACKHRQSCKKGGTVVQNKQCGGATSVTVVYPSQTAKPKPSCSVGFHSISFDCSSASSTVPPKTTPTTAPSKPTTSTYAVTTPTSVPTTKASSTASTAASSSSSVVSSVASSTSSTAPVASSTTTYPGSVPSSSATSSVVSSVVSSVASSSTAVISSSSVPATTSSVPATTSSIPATTSSAITSTIVTSYLSTSTIVSTVVSTVTSCAPTVSNCPAESVTRVTLTSVVGTTICPVTETQVITTSAATKSTAPVTPPVSVSVPAVTSSTAAISSTVTAPGPVETLPCPNVVPSCLNTWMFSVGCKDNTDSACFCPDQLFVENVFTCMYAHGETDQIISDAVVFFQGMCAPHIPTNPGIATGADTITAVITAQPTAPPQASYTTVTVSATTVVPCTTEGGATIPSSSSTVTISTVLTVPQVGFATVTPAGPSATPEVVPVAATTYPAAPGVPAPTTVTSTRPAGATGPVTTFTTAKPITGTGGQPIPTTTGVPVIAGAASLSSSFALVAAAVIAAVAAL